MSLNISTGLSCSNQGSIVCTYSKAMENATPGQICRAHQLQLAEEHPSQASSTSSGCPHWGLLREFRRNQHYNTFDLYDQSLRTQSTNTKMRTKTRSRRTTRTPTRSPRRRPPNFLIIPLVNHPTRQSSYRRFIPLPMAHDHLGSR